MIAFTKMYKGNFHIGVMRKDGSNERLLTKAFIDEGPTWAPNGRILMFLEKLLELMVLLHSYNRGNWQKFKKNRIKFFASDPSWSSLLK